MRLDREIKMAAEFVQCGICLSENISKDASHVGHCADCGARKNVGCAWYDPAGVRETVCSGGGLIADR